MGILLNTLYSIFDFSGFPERQKLIEGMTKTHPSYKPSWQYKWKGIPQGRHEFLIEARRRGVTTIKITPRYRCGLRKHWFGVKTEGFNDKNEKVLEGGGDITALTRSPAYIALSVVTPREHKRKIKQLVYDFYLKEGFNVIIDSVVLKLPPELHTALLDGPGLPKFERYDGEKIAEGIFD